MMRRTTLALGVTLGTCLWSGCTSAVHVAAPNLPPDAEPAEPLDWAGHEEMNTEFYIGSRAAEADEFARFAREINAIQMKQAKDHDQGVSRGFHAKAHGCLYGHLNLIPTRDPRARFGVFAEGVSSRPIWVRFSNGVGWSQADDKNDARGMAVKVMNVPGKKYAPDEESTQDFLMTNSPTPVGKNAEQFMDFAHANAAGLFPSLLFLVGHPVSGAPALLRTSPIVSAATESYYSGGAYHLGAHQAIKYMAKPCPGSPPRSSAKDDDDYLRDDLSRAAKGGLCYTMYVQFQVDPDRTPIENAAKAWSEDVSPLVPVANLELPPQAIDAPGEADLCRSLAFNPWHAIPAHKPMGHINRARRYVYASSRRFRSGGHEPHGFEGFDGQPASPPPAAAPSVALEGVTPLSPSPAHPTAQAQAPNAAAR
jgi:hypothetical protein